MMGKLLNLDLELAMENHKKYGKRVWSKYTRNQNISLTEENYDFLHEWKNKGHDMQDVVNVALEIFRTLGTGKGLNLSKLVLDENILYKP